MRPNGNRMLIGLALLGLALAASIATPAFAILGDFEADDGYGGIGAAGSLPAPNVAGVLNLYNAGQYGTSNGGPGGGIVFHAADDPSGLWNDLNDNHSDYVFTGGTGTSPNYYTTGHGSFPASGITPELVAHSGDKMMTMRTAGSTQPLSLDFGYTIDQRDFYNGGDPIDPATTGSHIIDWSIWACAGYQAVPPTDPLFPVGEFYWTFRDSDGNVGGQAGWDVDGNLQYRLTDGGTWVKPGLVITSEEYDQFNFTFNTASDQWSLSVFDNSATTLLPIFTNLSFGQPLNNLTQVDWHLGPGVEKVFFDDSVFSVTSIPEPSTFGLAAAGLLALSLLGWRRKRNRE